MDNLARSHRPDGTAQVVGVLPQTVLDTLARTGTPLSDPAVSIRASDVTHILRDDKASAGRAISLADLKRLPDLLAAPTAILLERRTGHLTYVFTPSAPAEARRGKLVVQLQVLAKLIQRGTRSREPVNAVISAGLVAAANLKDAAQYTLIEGSL